ncbi:MAG: sulfatase-like hydrolase/transferase [Candidatus Aminicenantes bacterium]|nr:sulfatase-like hydrolase/transferase [Candidatus Aminicenantes bacterium]
MGIKLSKKQRRYLRENYRCNSDDFLAKQLGVSEKFIHRALKQLNLKRNKEELKALQPADYKQSPKKEKINVGRIKFSRKFLFTSSLIIGILAVALIFFYSLTRYLSPKEGKYIHEIKKLMAPLKGSELNILFFTLDTTRADHIGCYGYEKVETPNIDRLAKNGIFFKNAICQSPLTLPSHSSIFTSTYPFYHGVRDNGGFYLEQDKVTFAEVLKENGWATSAFIGAFVLDSRWGLDQGIDYYYDNFDFAKYKRISLDSVQREGGEVIEAFFEWFERNQQKKFFSWIHLYDPHTPYDPPEPYKSRYSNRPWGFYDGEIAYVDFLIGKVLDNLRKKEILEKTIIVIVGDHGESLGEHRENRHGFFIYDATISVPLIIKIPSSKLGEIEVSSQVETIDIMPTLLQILGLPVPHEVQGKNLIPLIMGKNSREKRLAYSETYYPRYRYGWSELKSLRSTQYKYIQAPRPELYDLTKDPDEQYNVYKQNLTIGKKFEQKLKSLQEEMSAKGVEERGPQKLDEESREKLMALGYIGGFTSQSKLKKTENLPDPKDKIHLYKKIKEAEGASAGEELDEALEKISEVIEEDPRIMEALQIRSRIFLKLNKIEEAIEDCKEALKIDPEYEAAIFSLAHAYKRLKKYDEAIAGYERLMQLDPRDYKPPMNLGDIYLEMKDIDKAVPFLQQAIDLEPERSSKAHNLLGAVYLEKKMLEQAELEIKKALEMRPRIPDAHYNLALLYEEKKEIDKAVEEYKKEIELHPAAYPAHFNLAKLYEKIGYLREGIKHFKEAIKYKKDFTNGYIYLAKAYLDLGENLDEAIHLAKKGLELGPESEYAPLAHYILADIYNRLGQTDKYYEELQKGRQLQQKLEKNNQQNNLR